MRLNPRFSKFLTRISHFYKLRNVFLQSPHYRSLLPQWALSDFFYSNSWAWIIWKRHVVAIRIAHQQLSDISSSEKNKTKVSFGSKITKCDQTDQIFWHQITNDFCFQFWDFFFFVFIEHSWVFSLSFFLQNDVDVVDTDRILFSPIFQLLLLLWLSLLSSHSLILTYFIFIRCSPVCRLSVWIFPFLFRNWDK